MTATAWNADPAIDRLYPPMPASVPDDPWQHARTLVAYKRAQQTDPQEYFCLHGCVEGLIDSIIDELVAHVVMGWSHGPNARYWWMRHADGRLDATQYSRYVLDRGGDLLWEPTKDMAQACEMANRFVEKNRNACVRFEGGIARHYDEKAYYHASAQADFGTMGGDEVTDRASCNAPLLPRAICEAVVVLLAPADLG